jgi:hypothetical protein
LTVLRRFDKTQFNKHILSNQFKSNWLFVEQGFVEYLFVELGFVKPTDYHH